MENLFFFFSDIYDITMCCQTKKKNWLDRRTQWEGEISTIWRTLYVHHWQMHQPLFLPTVCVSLVPPVMVRCPCSAEWPVCGGQSMAFGGNRSACLVGWQRGLVQPACKGTLIGMKPARSVCQYVGQWISQRCSRGCWYVGTLVGSSDGSTMCRPKIAHCRRTHRKKICYYRYLWENERQWSKSMTHPHCTASQTGIASPSWNVITGSTNMCQFGQTQCNVKFLQTHLFFPSVLKIILRWTELLQLFTFRRIGAKFHAFSFISLNLCPLLCSEMDYTKTNQISMSQRRGSVIEFTKTWIRSLLMLDTGNIMTVVMVFDVGVIT